MIAVDTNVLVYAHREDNPFHPLASKRLKTLAEDRSLWAIPWPCLHEFFAIVTHPRIYKPATPLSRALDQIDAWMECPTLALLTESEQHWQQLRQLLQSGQVAGPQVHDARIAALCLQHGVDTLWTADRDFGRYPELTVVNPLVDAGPRRSLSDSG